MKSIHNKAIGILILLFLCYIKVNAQCHRLDSLYKRTISNDGTNCTYRVDYYYTRNSAGQTSGKIVYSTSSSGPWTQLSCNNLSGTNGSRDSVHSNTFTAPCGTPIYFQFSLWTNGTCGGSQCGNTISIAAASYFSAPASLPITFQNFNSSIEGHTSVLKWSTSFEQNNLGFYVERSEDGINSNTIGFVNSNVQGGFSEFKQDYTYTDINPLSNKNMYRLKQTDFDGNFEYSPIAILYFNDKNGLTISPSVAKDFVHIYNLLGGEDIRIFDAIGRLKTEFMAKESSIEIPIQNLIEGIYFIQIRQSDATLFTQKIIKE